MTNRILVAEDDPALRLLLRTVLEDHDFDVQTVADGQELVAAAREYVPDLLLVDVMMPVMNGLEAIRQLRHDTRTAHLPMLLLTALDNNQDAVAGYDTGADDYITKPFDNDVLIARIKANLRRIARASVNSPLTGLPGNVLINAEVNHLLQQDQPFALLYIDLNNFKAFNDAYGFARGDRVIRLMADLLRNHKQQYSPENSFIGHIGGDDFVALVPPEEAATWSQALIEQFDQRIPALYDASDSARGYLVGTDRWGTPHRFPLTSVSIGVVDTSKRQFTSYSEIAAVAAEAKGRAKKLAGSRYVFDERQRRRASPAPGHERRGQPPLVVVVAASTALQAQATAWSGAHGLRSQIFATAPTIMQLTGVSPHLILLDLGMPGAWGWLQNTRAAYPELPIVALAQSAVDQARALQAGATVCFTMNVAPEVMAEALTYLLRPEGVPVFSTIPGL